MTKRASGHHFWGILRRSGGITSLDHPDWDYDFEYGFITEGDPGPFVILLVPVQQVLSVKPPNLIYQLPQQNHAFILSCQRSPGNCRNIARNYFAHGFCQPYCNINANSIFYFFFKNKNTVMNNFASLDSWNIILKSMGLSKCLIWFLTIVGISQDTFTQFHCL